MSDTESDTDDSTASDPTVEEHSLELDMAEDVAVYEHMSHRTNGDETAVLLCSFADGYQAFALDVTAGGELLEIEEIGHGREEARVVGMIEHWLKQHPKGVLGGEPDGGGFLGDLLGGDDS